MAADRNVSWLNKLESSEFVLENVAFWSGW